MSWLLLLLPLYLYYISIDMLDAQAKDIKCVFGTMIIQVYK